jgi:O-antigen/teichoic acid export membrane protein
MKVAQHFRSVPATMGEIGHDSDHASSGLGYVLGATIVAGGLGYVIQGVVPIFVAPSEYVVFSVFWATLYLIVSALSGAQQEVTRASRPATKGSAAVGWRLVRFAFVIVAISVIVVAGTAPLWAPSVLSAEWIPLTVALLAGVVGYTLVAVLSGALYGLRSWPAVAALTVMDATVRVCAVIVALIVGAGIVGLSWAVALPFAVAFGVVLLISRDRLRGSLTIDASLARLLRNAASTVTAALCTGILISGLPLVLQLTLSDAPTAMLASLILVITLTRAPLVIPLLALQSYLVVTFRDQPDGARGRLLRWGGLLGAVTAVLAIAAASIGPWVLDVVYAGKYELPGVVIGAIVASAGITAGLCLTGPALIAADEHGLYLLGWLFASAGVIALLFLPLAPIEAALLALIAAPLAGIAIHVSALAMGRTS